MNKRPLLPTAVALALAACDYGVPSEVVDGVIVYTQPLVAEAEFGPLRTYYLDPQMRVREDGEDKPDQPINAGVKTAIDQEMAAAGYTPAAQIEADVGLKVSLATNSADYYYTGGWCDIYYGYYGCYYPPVYAGSYRYGTVLLAMVDLRTPPAAGQPFPGLWYSVMYGVAWDWPNTNWPRVIDGVMRSFDQSPYLQTTAP
jgi:hypothetical protein